MPKARGLIPRPFIELANKMSAYGLNSADRAMDMARNQAMWSRFTGADSGAIQKHEGLAYRYRGEGDATAIAYGGLKAQNMEKGQFSEYLTAMERIMEDGIAKGFAKSSKEVAGNLQMLYEMSGKSVFWQGEQGAQRLSQMNASISSAAALETPAHDIVYASMLKAINEGNEEGREASFHRLAGYADNPEKNPLVYTNTYIDVQQLLEQGIKGPLMRNIKEMVEGFEKGNIAGQVQYYKEMFGLNTIGGAQLYKMMRNAKPEDFDDETWVNKAKALAEDPEHKSDSQKLQNMLNDINNNVVKIGKFKFDDTEWGILKQEADNVAAILAAMPREKEIQNLGITPGDRRVPGMLYDKYGDYGEKVADISAWLTSQYEAGTLGYNRESLSGFSMAGRELNELNLIISGAVKDYTSLESEEGAAITRNEFSNILSRIEAAITKMSEEGRIKLDPNDFKGLIKFPDTFHIY
jgi:hypothetical protein